MSKKPLNRKAYGSIPHLPGSKRGPGDKGVNAGQAAIVCKKPRPGDRIFVEEKIDGSCVAIAKIDGTIVPLVRAGYRAESSPYEQHHLFAKWVMRQWQRWDDLLEEGDRLVGEWCALCHSTRYDFSSSEPFYAFDLMREDVRLPREKFWQRTAGKVQVVPLLAEGPTSIDRALTLLGDRGLTGCACDKPEGAVWRCEADGEVEFLAKYVRPDFQPGRYLPEVNPELTERVLVEAFSRPHRTAQPSDARRSE